MRLTGRSLGYGAVAYGQIAVYQQSGAVTPVTPDEERFVPGHRHSGGWTPPQRRYRTEEEILARRIELGIIPAPVEKVVEKAARKVIAKAKAQEASVERPDPLAWLQAHHAQQSAILAADLRKRQIEASLADRQTYMILLAIEIERVMRQEMEDEQIVMLLMEM